MNRIPTHHSSLITLHLALLVSCGCGGGAVLERQPERQAAAIKESRETGDSAEVSKLVAELADEDIGWVAWEKLRRTTGQEFGDPYTAEGRRRAAECWTKWQQDRNADRPAVRGH